MIFRIRMNIHCVQSATATLRGRHEVHNGYAELVGEQRQRTQLGVTGSSLEPAHVADVQTAEPGQFFLAELGLLAVFLDVRSHNRANFVACSSLFGH